MAESGLEITEETEVASPRQPRNKEAKPKLEGAKKSVEKKEEKQKLERRKLERRNASPPTRAAISSNFSFKALLVASVIFGLVLLGSYFLPGVLPYKEISVNLQKVSLDAILNNQPTTLLFQNQKEFYDGKFYVLNDGSKDLGTFTDKATGLEEAAALGSQIKVFEITKAGNLEVTRTQILS